MALTDLTGTKWYFNKDQILGNFISEVGYQNPYAFNLNFTSNNNNYNFLVFSRDLTGSYDHYNQINDTSSIFYLPIARLMDIIVRFGYSDGKEFLNNYSQIIEENPEIISYIRGTFRDPAFLVRTNNSWSDTSYKTIEITGGTDATNTTLISALQQIATQILPSVVRKIKLPGSSTVYNIGTTWDNVSNKPDLMTTSEITAAINAAFATNDAMIFKGTIGQDGTITQLPATHEAGWTYKVITAGSLAGQTCEIGDMIVCIKDGTVATANDWTIIQTNVDGAVVGPASSTAEHIATFTGTTGKVIKDSGFTIATSVPANASFTDTTVQVVRMF